MFKDRFYISFNEEQPGGGGTPAPTPTPTPTPTPETVSKDDYIKLQQELDAIKAKNAEAEKKANESKGKYKELYEAEQSKVKELEDFKTKYETLETEQRTELLGQLSDEHKEIAKDLPISNLRSYVKLNNKDIVGVDNGKGASGNISIGNKKYDDFSMEERGKLAEKQPSDYKRIYKEKFGFEPVL